MDIWAKSTPCRGHSRCKVLKECLCVWVCVFGEHGVVIRGSGSEARHLGLDLWSLAKLINC